MHMRSLLSAGAGALALGLLATSAQAAPASVNLPAVAQDAGDGGLVQQVHRYRDYDYYYNRPYYRHRYYRNYDYYYYRPNYYYYNPYYYNYRYRHRNW
jgi:hypothetical protein